MNTSYYSEFAQPQGEADDGPGALDEHVSEAQLAAEFGKSPRTLQRWRRMGEGPAHIRLGDTVMYRRSAVTAWLLELERRET